MTNTTGRKTQRRSPKEGSTFRRKDRPGWRGELAYVDALGKRRRVVVSGATEEEARDKLNRERERLRIGLAGKAEAGTVGEWLFRWLPAYQASVRPSTYLVAEQYVRAYLVPALGRI
ncbi:MAG TPA: hypothetical protein VFW20_00875, partial [Candidatus Limnocylindrales bacterium]|nr:hypothetical protein [Candidatus Limnocylindrales bacterium]